MKTLKRTFKKIALALAFFTLVLPALAQTGAIPGYPSKPIRLVIPFSPGGGTDIVGRMIAQKLSEAWGQQVVVDNRAGANGTIGAELVAKSPADGYTLCMFTASHTVNVTLQGVQQPYDLNRDFAPIALLAVQPYILVVRPTLAAQTVGDVIALAKSKPGALTYGSSGIGGLLHLSGELFATIAKIKLAHVPYKGGAQAMMDVVGGNIDMMFTSFNQSSALIDAGRLRLLAVTTTKRSPAAPNVPTMHEAGVPGFAVESWYGMATTAGTPANVVSALNREINRILKLPEVSDRMAADGATPAGGSGAEFGKYLRAEVDKWRRTIRSSGITPG